MPYYPVQGEDGHGASLASSRGLLLTNADQLDAGMHPAKDGFSSLPFFDEFDLSTVDILLISQYVGSISPLQTFPPPQLSLRLCRMISRVPLGDAQCATASEIATTGGLFYLAIPAYPAPCIATENTIVPPIR